MKRESALEPVASCVPQAWAARATRGQPNDKADGWLALLLRHLRGRMLWAGFLGLILGSIGAYSGFRLGQKTYTSRGLIRVAPVLPVVLKPTDEKGLMPMYDLFVDAQMEYIRSQRVVELAMNSPEWRSLGRETGNKAIRSFGDNLKVLRNGEVIVVEMTDPDPRAAMIGAKAVIEAYRRLHVEDDSQSGERRLELLEQRRAALDREVVALRQQVKKIADQYGTEDLLPLYTAKLGEVAEYEKNIKAAEAALRVRIEGAATQPSRYLAVEEIAWEDARMAGYLREREQAERALQRLTRRLGENHASVRDAREELSNISRRIEEYAAMYRERRIVQSLPDAGMAWVTTEQLRNRLSDLQTLCEKARGDLLDIGRQRLQILSLKEQLDGVRSRLEETSRRIEQLNIESGLAGRISVISDGERPLGPRRDTRWPFGIAGGLGGFWLGVGTILLIGVLDQRLRSPEDAPAGISSDVVLGALPELGEDAGGSVEASLAAHCVHRIRTMLQIRDGNSQGKAFAITSPSSGTGKTSLTLALGISFAGTESRTLMVDCDVLGGGLTTRLNAVCRQKLGQLLRRRNLASLEQVREGLQLAEASHRRLGEALVQLGYVKEGDLSECLAMQAETVVGLPEALAGEELAHCIAETGVANLHILPLGAFKPHQAGMISPSAMRRLVDAAKREYDTILIDTGPFLGSLEAAAVAAAADGVILTVSRGDQRPLAERCIRQLNAINAPLAGVVFNRATTRDMLRASGSGYATTARRRTSASISRRAALPAGGESSNLGPIARALTRPASSTNSDSTGP